MNVKSDLRNVARILAVALILLALPLILSMTLSVSAEQFGGEQIGDSAYTHPPALVTRVPYGVTPTTEWVNFRSQNTTVFGSPVPIGAVVRAYDPQDTQCGEFVVNHAGWYGLMPCYADDPMTPGDEGARPGDRIHFTIDGLPAVPMGPDQPIWTTNGGLLVVDLAVTDQPPTVTPTATPVGTIPAPTSSPAFWLFLPLIQKW